MSNMGYLPLLKSWTKARIRRITATTSKTAIVVLSAVILALIVSVSVFRSVRFFCWEHPGILLVVLAVAGEVICDWNRKKNLKERLKKAFGMLLVAGLILEIVEAARADRDVAVANLEAKRAGTNAAASYERAAVAEREAGQANERAANTESNNFVLQKQMQPRIITMEQVTNFIFLTAKVPKIPIKICIGQESAETETFAYQFRDMFNQAGFKLDSSAGLFGITRRPDFRMVMPINRNDYGDIYFITMNTNWNGVVAYPLNVEITNGLTRPIITNGDNVEAVYEGIQFALGQINIDTKRYISDTNSVFVNSGEFGFLVPDKK
jgi:hypothetical protein